MPDRQLIRVISTDIADTDLARLRGQVGRGARVLTAPTPEAARVVKALGVDPKVEVLLAPVRFPPVDRGHQLDALVRSHALHDRYRDVVVVVDRATSTLLLRVLAPDQLAEAGPEVVVGLPRSPRPLEFRRAGVGGAVIGVLSGALEPLAPLPLIPGVALIVGLVLFALPSVRHYGREVLLAVLIGFGVMLMVVASLQRFPGGPA